MQSRQDDGQRQTDDYGEDYGAFHSSLPILHLGIRIIRMHHQFA